ncbi:pyruvate kinase [Vibrio chagasii]|nr:pyruvate kinase [Vibrio chagasii]
MLSWWLVVTSGRIGDPELVGVQKATYAALRALNRTIITATQMMESMISAQCLPVLK